MRPPLSADVLTRLAPLVEEELRRYLHSVVKACGPRMPLDPGTLRKAAALEHACKHLFGVGLNAEDRKRFLAFAAPIARRLLIAYVSSGEVTLPQQLSKPMLLKHWLARLETFDAPSVLMIDLHYFCGVGIKETAAVLGVSVATVLRDLRFAKRWLQAYAGWPA